MATACGPALFAGVALSVFCPCREPRSSAGAVVLTAATERAEGTGRDEGGDRDHE